MTSPAEDLIIWKGQSKDLLPPDYTAIDVHNYIKADTRLSPERKAALLKELQPTYRLTLISVIGTRIAKGIFFVGVALGLILHFYPEILNFFR